MKHTDFRAAREGLGLTQRQLAEALGMGRHGWQAISGWENGRKPIPGTVLVALRGLVSAAAA